MGTRDGFPNPPATGIGEPSSRPSPAIGFAWIAAVAVLVCWCTAAAAATDDSSAGDAGPLVLLAQGDGTVASAPAQPSDPPEGATLRLRRVRVGEDVSGRIFRVRGVLEAVSAGGLGTYFTPVEGGRLMGPLGATALAASWTPHA